MFASKYTPFTLTKLLVIEEVIAQYADHEAASSLALFVTLVLMR